MLQVTENGQMIHAARQIRIVSLGGAVPPEVERVKGQFPLKKRLCTVTRRLRGTVAGPSGTGAWASLMVWPCPPRQPCNRGLTRPRQGGRSHHKPGAINGMMMVSTEAKKKKIRVS